MEKTIKTKKLTNYCLFTIFIILFLGFAVNNIVYTEAASCAGNWINPHWACSSGQCQRFDTCGYNSCSSNASCTTTTTTKPSATTTTKPSATTTTKPSTTTTTSGGGALLYKCTTSNGAGLCNQSTSGTYSSWDSCTTACFPDWSCGTNSGCYAVPYGSGEYGRKDQCEPNCRFGYNCYPGLVCRYDWLGIYTTLSFCEACCSDTGCAATTYYSCNPDPDNPRCIVDSKGSYTSWAYCEDNCGSNGDGGGTTTTTTTTKPTTTTTTTQPSTTTTTTTSPPPTCKIFKFTINEKNNSFQDPLIVWVNASLTGFFSVNDVCTSCKVTSNDNWNNTYDPLPASGYVTEPFKINTAGPYSYTLECVGTDPEDIAIDALSLQTVKAINLPWWREIIPVLPGFLRGLWR